MKKSQSVCSFFSLSALSGCASFLQTAAVFWDPINSRISAATTRRRSACFLLQDQEDAKAEEAEVDLKRECNIRASGTVLWKIWTEAKRIQKIEEFSKWPAASPETQESLWKCLAKWAIDFELTSGNTEQHSHALPCTNCLPLPSGRVASWPPLELLVDEEESDEEESPSPLDQSLL